MPDERILVTGGTGFLGRHLVMALLERGQRVRVLCRSIPRNPHRCHGPVDYVAGDVTDPSSIRLAMRDIRYLYHVAGRVDFNPTDMRLLLAVNENGTRNVFTSAAEHGVRRIVHVSSVSTIGGAESPDRPLSESDFGRGRGVEIPYPQSKLRGERVALEFARRGLDIVIVNPTFFAGPGDHNLSSARTILAFMHRQVWVGLNTGGFGYTDVRDVARGLILAMDKGSVGERYILGGHNLLTHQYHAILEEITGSRAPWLRVPPRIATWLARFGVFMYRAAGVPTYVGTGDVRMARQYWIYDYSKARSELGLTCRAPEDSLRDAVEWLVAEGLCSAKNP